jgi:hypothetical protein
MNLAPTRNTYPEEEIMSESSRSIKPHVPSPRPFTPGVSSIISGGLRREVESIEEALRVVEAFSREADEEAARRIACFFEHHEDRIGKILADKRGGQ